MNTPKYKMSVNRHTMHTTSHSPLRNMNVKSRESKYYSAE